MDKGFIKPEKQQRMHLQTLTLIHPKISNLNLYFFPHNTNVCFYRTETEMQMKISCGFVFENAIMAT